MVSTFGHGDRIRHSAVPAETEIPLIRYGFVVGTNRGDNPVMIMFDGDLRAGAVTETEIEHVRVSNLTLTLDGHDLLDDPSLRQGLVNLWVAEAECAGLRISSLDCMGTGVRDSREGYALARLTSGGEQYVLRGSLCMYQYNAIVVHADRPNRWEVPTTYG